MNRSERLFKAISHERRLGIVLLLADGSGRSITEIARLIRTNQPTISKDIELLTSANVIKKTREGGRLLCSLNKRFPYKELSALLEEYKKL